MWKIQHHLMGLSCDINIKYLQTESLLDDVFLLDINLEILEIFVLED